jgi:hypothetical protein
MLEDGPADDQDIVLEPTQVIRGTTAKARQRSTSVVSK